MCGILGKWRFDGGAVQPGALRRLAARMRHRGPDDEGYVGIDPGQASWTTAGGPTTPPSSRGVDGLPYSAPAVEIDSWSAPLVLGQLRLSIIDLSARGHQPMCNEDGTVWVVFGGEIYNYLELRSSLKGRGHRFRSDTDTEVLVHGYEEWGDDLYGRLNGMWAFALWDGRRRRLVVSRDRLGIKPFYYRHTPTSFAFTSEINPLLDDLRAAGEAPAPHAPAIAGFVAEARTDHTDETFFSGIRSLPAAHYATVDAEGVRLRRYWGIEPQAAVGDLHEAAGLVRESLSEAVRLRLRADVPVGTCLSGGLDSSGVLCLGTAHLGRPLRAYSVAYEGLGPFYDERPHMQAVVAATGAAHRLKCPGPADFWEWLKAAVRVQQEPAAGPGVLSQYAVMEAAHEDGAKVLLDGQGGDELFAGYVAFHLPLALRDRLVGGDWREAWALWRRLPAFGRRPLEVLGRAFESELPTGAVRFWRRCRGTGDWAAPLRADFRSQHCHPPPPLEQRGDEALNSRLYWDLVRDILPSLLRYEDRNSMAFSIEARVPYLDVHLVENAFTLSGTVKQTRDQSKAVLRQALAGVVPTAVLERQDKLGYETPAALWLKQHHAGTLRTHLLEGVAVGWDILEPGAVAIRLDHFLNQPADAGHDVWRLINLELWLREYFDGATACSW